MLFDVIAAHFTYLSIWCESVSALVSVLHQCRPCACVQWDGWDCSEHIHSGHYSQFIAEPSDTCQCMRWTQRCMTVKRRWHFKLSVSMSFIVQSLRGHFNSFNFHRSQFTCECWFYARELICNERNQWKIMNYYGWLLLYSVFCWFAHTFWSFHEIGTHLRANFRYLKWMSVKNWDLWELNTSQTP